MVTLSLTVRLLVTVLWAAATATVLAAGRRLRPTTLGAAWRWTVAAMTLWSVAWLATIVPNARDGSRDQLWYAAAVLSLCPMIAVLGARRPGSRVWTWFVLVPLVLVLEWPAVALGVSGSLGTPLEVSPPVLMGFGLVLLMGAGNYLPTRYGMPALMTVVALVGVLLTARDGSRESSQTEEWWRSGATAAVAVAAIWAGRVSRWPTLAANPYDRVWFDYRDAFGIVWARRLLERINERAVAEGWPCRLAEGGFQWDEGVDERRQAETGVRIDHTFRWLLRRFVDPEWIDARLGTSELPGLDAPTGHP